MFHDQPARDYRPRWIDTQESIHGATRRDRDWSQFTRAETIPRPSHEIVEKDGKNSLGLDHKMEGETGGNSSDQRKDLTRRPWRPLSSSTRHAKSQ